MGHIAPQQQDVEGCNRAEAMAAMGLAIIARKRNNACTRRIANFVLPEFKKIKLLVKGKERPLETSPMELRSKRFGSRT